MDRRTTRRNIAKSRAHRVFYSNDVTFEVDDGVNRHSVNFREFLCTCKKWQSTQWPCVHVAKVCEDTARDINKYCSEHYTSELWRLAYKETIYPIPTLQGPPATLDEIGNLPSNVLLSFHHRSFHLQQGHAREGQRDGELNHKRFQIRKMDYWPLIYVFVLTSFQEEFYTRAKIMGPC